MIVTFPSLSSFRISYMCIIVFLPLLSTILLYYIFSKESRSFLKFFETLPSAAAPAPLFCYAQAFAVRSYGGAQLNQLSLLAVRVFNAFNTFNRFSTKSCTKGFVHIATLSTIQQVFNKSFNNEICLFFTMLCFKFMVFNFSTASTTTTTTSYI